MDPHPAWATSKSTNLPASVVARGVYSCVFSAQNCFICLRAVLVTFLLFLAPRFTFLSTSTYHRLARSIRCLSVGSKIDHPQKNAHLGVQPPSDFRDTSNRLHGRRLSLARSISCAVARRLGAITQRVVGALFKIFLFKKGRDGGCTSMFLLDILSSNRVPEQELIATPLKFDIFLCLNLNGFGRCLKNTGVIF